MLLFLPEKHKGIKYDDDETVSREAGRLDQLDERAACLSSGNAVLYGPSHQSSEPTS